MKRTCRSIFRQDKKPKQLEYRTRHSARQVRECGQTDSQNDNLKNKIQSYYMVMSQDKIKNIFLG